MSYSVVFTGELKPSLSHEKVMTNLSLLFKKDISFINKLFSGQQIIIKRDLDLDSANKYKMALASAGAICEVQESPEAVKNDVIPTKTETVITVAAAGETLIEAPPPTPANYDTSHYSMAEPGEKIIEQEPVKASPVDVLSADLSPLGTVLSEDKPITSADIDVANMSLAESGSDILDKD